MLKKIGVFVITAMMLLMSLPLNVFAATTTTITTCLKIVNVETINSDGVKIQALVENKDTPIGGYNRTSGIDSFTSNSIGEADIRIISKLITGISVNGSAYSQESVIEGGHEILGAYTVGSVGLSISELDISEEQANAGGTPKIFDNKPGISTYYVLNSAGTSSGILSKMKLLYMNKLLNMISANNYACIKTDKKERAAALKLLDSILYVGSAPATSIVSENDISQPALDVRENINALHALAKAEVDDEHKNAINSVDNNYIAGFDSLKTPYEQKLFVARFFAMPNNSLVAGTAVDALLTKVIGEAGLNAMNETKTEEQADASNGNDSTALNTASFKKRGDQYAAYVKKDTNLKEGERESILVAMTMLGSNQYLNAMNEFHDITTTSQGGNEQVASSCATAQAKFQEYGKITQDPALLKEYLLPERINFYFFAGLYGATDAQVTSEFISLDNEIGTASSSKVVPVLALCKPDDEKSSALVSKENYRRFELCVQEFATNQAYLCNTLSTYDDGTKIPDNQTLRILKSLQQAYSAVCAFPIDTAVVKQCAGTKGWQEIKDLWTAKPGDCKFSLNELWSKFSKYCNFDSTTNFTAGTADEALRQFINLADGTVNSSIAQGVCLSATFVPYKTNLYDVSTFKLVAEKGDFLTFHTRYGYYRKALYIDKNLKSVTETYTTNKSGTLRVATLNDMMEYSKDISLYTDTNFYNVKDLQAYKDEAIKLMDNTAKAENASSSWWTRLWQSFSDAFNLSLYDVVKTGKIKSYAPNLADVMTYSASKEVMKTDADEKIVEGLNKKEGAVLGGNEIDKYLGQSTTDKSNDYLNYNVMIPFAVTSAIYRDKTLYNLCTSSNYTNKPVYQSSPNAIGVEGAPEYVKNTYFNYIQLRNSYESMPVSYNLNLDRNKPIYIDIYGNICTESGYVIVPAASNASMTTEYTPYTAGFICTYGDSYKIPSSVSLQGTALESLMYVNDEGNYDIAPMLLDETIDLNKLSLADQASLKKLKNLWGANFINKSFKFENYVVNIFTEVLRGAPVDRIDKQFEGLTYSNGITKDGIIKAAKLDSLKDSLETKGTNTLLNMPNLAFTHGTEYIVLLLYKLMMLLVAASLFIQLFVFGMKGTLGVKAIGKMVLSIILVLCCFTVIPFLFNFSYYQSNKELLKDKIVPMTIVNYEKQEAGMEVGVSSVDPPKVTSKYYLKMKDVNIPWYDLFYRIGASDVDANLTKIYEEYSSKDLAFGEKDFEFYNGALYVDVNKMYNSCDIVFDPRTSILGVKAESKTPASFYTPYYVYLKQLTMSVQSYNFDQNSFGYSTAIYAGGKVKSLGLCKSYFLSEDFLTKKTDLLGIGAIYKLQDTYGTVASNYFTDEELETIRKSEWVDGSFSNKEVNERIAKLDERAKQYISRNRTLLGTVSDDAFLKGMAMDLALYSNQIFNTPSAKSIEIYNMSTDDLIRMLIMPEQDVVKDSPLGFSRFVYENSGVVGVYAAAILELVVFVCAYAKPLMTMIVMLMVFASLFIYKLILNKKEQSFKGYFLVIGLVCLCNFLYALMLNLTMKLPMLSISPAICLLLQSMLQLLLLAFYVYITVLVIRNWKDLGAAKISDGALNLKSLVADKLNIGDGGIFHHSEHKHHEHKDSKIMEKAGWKTYERLKESDNYRTYHRKDDD